MSFFLYHPVVTLIKAQVCDIHKTRTAPEQWQQNMVNLKIIGIPSEHQIKTILYLSNITPQPLWPVLRSVSLSKVSSCRGSGPCSSSLSLSSLSKSFSGWLCAVLASPFTADCLSFTPGLPASCSSLGIFERLTPMTGLSWSSWLRELDFGE